jgi:hypothetical protein
VRDSVAAEQASAVAFEAIANSDVLDEGAAATMRVLLDHSKTHATVLADAYERATSEDPPLPPRRAEIPGVKGIRTRRGALRLAERIEDAVVATHLDTARLTRNSTILKLVGGAMGTDAQHLVMLRELLGEHGAPDAFERGGPRSALP